jgi:hypothetical protein
MTSSMFNELILSLKPADHIVEHQHFLDEKYCENMKQIYGAPCLSDQEIIVGLNNSMHFSNYLSHSSNMQVKRNF